MLPDTIPDACRLVCRLAERDAEIERLGHANVEFILQGSQDGMQINSLQAEIERLRAELAAAKSDLKRLQQHAGWLDDQFRASKAAKTEPLMTLTVHDDVAWLTDDRGGTYTMVSPDELATLVAAKVAAFAWTREKPTEPGIYLWQAAKGGRITLLMVDARRIEELGSPNVGGRFAGPIPEPQESPTHIRRAEPAPSTWTPESARLRAAPGAFGEGEG